MNDVGQASAATVVTIKAVFDRATLTLRSESYGGDASAVEPVLQSTLTVTWQSIDSALAENRPIGRQTSVGSVIGGPAGATTDCTVTYQRHYDPMGRITEIVSGPHVYGCTYTVSVAYTDWDAFGRPTKGTSSSAAPCMQQPITQAYDDQARTVTTVYEEAPECQSSTVVTTDDADGLLISYVRTVATSSITTTYTTLETGEICP